jgi:osmotically-inducible protein OsmY
MRREHEQWRQADKRIRRDVSRAFDFRSDLESANIRVKVHRCAVILEGTVPDRRSRRLVEETAAGIRGVRVVHNRLIVVEDDPTDANAVFVLPLVAR